MRPAVLSLLLLLCAHPVMAAGGDGDGDGDGTAPASDAGWHGELHVRGDAFGANPSGPLALARARDPDVAGGPEPDLGTATLELRRAWRHGSLGLSTQLQWRGRHDRDGRGDGRWRVNEMALTGDHGAWQSTAGRKVVSWDVGQAFRPNDLVQQEARRTLLPPSLQGRPLLQLEHFDADSSTALVWVNPQHLRRAEADARGPDESALAARWYGRAADGTVDLHAFGRLGRHTGASLGAATAWVASDTVEVHASARALQRHDGWQGPDGDPAAVMTDNPWAITTLGASSQALLGASWTGSAQQSLLVEWWWDGTAPSDAQWSDWHARNVALARLPSQPGLPAAAVAGQLAWQASPLAGVLGAPALRRQNLFLRAAWQPGAWTAAMDAWITPADRGRALTASLQWQGDRLKLQAAVRQLGGPAQAVLAQLPTRRSAALMASWSF